MSLFQARRAEDDNAVLLGRLLSTPPRSRLTSRGLGPKSRAHAVSCALFFLPLIWNIPDIRLQRCRREIFPGSAWLLEIAY